MSQNPSEHRLGRIPMIEVEQPAEPLAPLDPTALIHRHRRAFQHCVVETFVVPLTVVVGDVLADRLPQMPFSQVFEQLECRGVEPLSTGSRD